MGLLKLLSAFLLVTSVAFAQQKVVLISGATSGIGLATAKAFQEKGWKVWAGFREYVPDELKHIANIRLCHLDVTDDRLIQEAIEIILKEDGRIDALINNAGYGLIGAEECVTLEEAKHVFDVNFFGALRLSQAVLPTMRQQCSGHILNISSGAGVIGRPGLGLYSASKFALEGLTESMAASLSPWKIKVSVIEPGRVQTNGGQNCIVGTRKCNEEFYLKLTQGICKMVATPRGQLPEDVASLLVKIAETAEPNIRYQTSQNMEDCVAEIFVDPTGNKQQEQNLQFLNHIVSGNA